MEQVNKNLKPLKKITCRNENCKRGEGGTRKVLWQRTTRQEYCCLYCGKEDRKEEQKLLRRIGLVSEINKSSKKRTRCKHCNKEKKLNRWGYCPECWTYKCNRYADGCEYM